MYMRTDLLLIIALTGVMGIVLILSGLFYKVYSGIAELLVAGSKPSTGNILTNIIYNALYKTMGLPIIKNVRDKAEAAFFINSFIKDVAVKRAGIASFTFLVFCLFNILALKNVGDLWYTKVFIILISIFLPYYLFTLILDLMKDKVNRQVPALIDEFRGAFLKHERIKPALLESARHTGGRLGEIVERAVLSTDVIKSLQDLKSTLNNIWFGIFAQLLINFKANGGELLEQLYKLNKTMVLYNNLEKKKSKRLIWYEIFAISVAFVSIPIIFWFNTKLLGSEGFIASDTEANLIVSRIIGLSIFSLVVIRVLRKL